MIKYLGALIAVKDMALSRRFYEETLGQTVTDDFGENVAFADGFSIHLKEKFEKLLGNGEQLASLTRSHAGELYFEADEIDAVEKRLKEAGVEFLHPVLEQPWGQRCMRLYDPDGHVLEIGEPMELMVQRFFRQGFSVESICQKSGMSRVFVEGVVRDARGGQPG